MWGVGKMLTAAALAVLIAVVLAACGDGDSGDSTAGSTAATTQKAPPPTAPGDDGSGGERQQPAAAPESAPTETATPEGAGSFRRPGADNSIQEYGEEADDAELEAASEVAVAYMGARAQGDWKKTCTYMAESAVKPLERIAASSPQFEGDGCAAVLEAFLGSTPAPDRASTIAGGVGSLRVDGARAFALYHGTDGRDYFLPLVEEDGEWKIGALAESPLP